VLAGAAVLYQLLFVTHGGSSEAFEAPVGSVLHAAWRLGSERVLTEPLVGSVGRFHLEQTGVPLVTYLPVVVVAMFLFVRSLHLSDPAKARLTAVGYLVVAMTLLIAFARFGWFEDMLHWGHRYTYVQKLLVYFGVAVAVFASGRRPVAWAVMLLLHVALLAWLDQRPYQVSRVRGERVMHFVRQAAAWRDDPGSVGEQMVYDEAARQLVIRRAPGDRPSSSPRRP
jgi:hypothetical protein